MRVVLLSHLSHCHRRAFCLYLDDGPDPNWYFLKLEMDAPQGNTVIVCQPRYACVAVPLLTQKDDRPAL
jgi:hypothetical protein